MKKQILLVVLAALVTTPAFAEVKTKDFKDTQIVLSTRSLSRDCESDVILLKAKIESTSRVVLKTTPCYEDGINFTGEVHVLK